MKSAWMKLGTLHAAFALRYLPRDEIKAFRADLHFVGRNVSNYAFDFSEGHEWIENWDKHETDDEELLYRVDYSVAYRANIDRCLKMIHKLIDDYGLDERQFKIWIELDGALDKRPFGFIYDDEETPF